MAGTTFTWTTAGSSVWTLGTNWFPAGPPTAVDTAIVPTGTVLVNTGTVGITDLSLGGSLVAPIPGKGTVEVTAGAAILASDAIALWSGSTLSVDAASSVDIGPAAIAVAGNVDIESGHTLQGDGLVQASVVNNGTIDVLGTVASNVFTPGTLEITGSLTGSGEVALTGMNAIVQFDGAVATTQTINFGTGSELILSAPGSGFAVPITNLNTGDKIEFAGLQAKSASVTSPGTITVITNTGSYLLTNVSFGAGSSQQFFTGTDFTNGDGYIQVAPPFSNWAGGSGDLGVTGNWQGGLVPNSTRSASFFSNPGTLTGSAAALSLNISGTGTWTFNGATITVAGQPSPPFLPYGGSFGTNVVITNASSLTVAATDNVGSTTGATVTESGGSQVTTDGDTIGSSAGQFGSLTVTGTNTKWTEQSATPINGSYPGFLTVGNAGTGTLNVNGGGIVSPGGNFVVGNNAGGSGAVTIGSGGTISVGGTFNAVGNNAGSTGSLSISTGGTLDFTTAPQSNSIVLSIGRAAAAAAQPEAMGSVTVTGTGASLNTNDNPLDVGRGGLGSLTVSQGGSVAAGTPDSNLIYGLSVAYSGGTGSVTVTDPGSTFTLTGFGFDGRGGNGTLTVENSGNFVVNDAPANGGGFNIGVGRGLGPTAPTNVGGTGTALVTSNGLLKINSNTSGIGVGGNGASGVLTVNNNGTVLAGTGMTIGTATEAGGTIYGGAGTLDIGPNGLVRASNPTLTGYAIVVGGANSSIGGPTTADSGTVLVSGTGALLDGNGAGVVVGLLSPGSLVISQGGKVVSGTPDNATFSAVGVGREANGSLTITDPGSSETANGLFYVGRAAAGTLTVENHGSLNVGVDGLGKGDLNIGGAGLANGSTLVAGGSGTGLVTTSGDVFSQQNVIVGENGTDGALTINGGGTVEAERALLLGDSVTLAVGDTIISPGGTTTVSSPTVVSANGNITVGAGGLLKADGTGVAVGQPNIIVGDGTGSTGTLTVSGAGATVDSTGDLSAGQNPGGTGDVSTNAGGQVEVSGNLIVWQGSTVSVLDGTSGIDVGTSLAAQSGDVLVEAGHELYGDGMASAAVLNNGTVIATNNGTFGASTGGKLELTGAISGTGTAELASGSTLALDSTLISGQTVLFDSGIAETLILGLPGSDLSNPLNEVGLGDRIELGNGTMITGVNMLNTNTAEVFIGATGTYDITNINFAAGASQFSFGHDSTSGDDFIQAIAPCFVAGTRISTEHGEVAVEELSEGDRVQCVLGGPAAPVIWIGHRTVSCTRHAQPRNVWPVRISAHAFGPGRPCRDLYLSPDHALYVGDALIPVKHLINGASIAQIRVDEVTYYHVELPQHSVLLAEGLAAESYLDTGDRSNFSNCDGPLALYPDFASRIWDAKACAPLVVTGPALEAARRWVNGLAGRTILAA